MPNETDDNDWITLTTDQVRDHVHDWIDDLDDPSELARLIQNVCGFKTVAVVQDGVAIAMADDRSRWTTLTVDDARGHLLDWVEQIGDPKLIAQLLQEVCGCPKVAVLPGGHSIACQIH